MKKILIVLLFACMCSNGNDNIHRDDKPGKDRGFYLIKNPESFSDHPG